METKKLIEQMELYSNALVGFIVAQSVTFSFTFGNNPAFGCEITKYKSLSIGLALHFAVSTVLAAWAIAYLADKIVALSAENGNLVRLLFRGKTAIIVLFAAIPIALLLAFGFVGQAQNGRCAPFADRPAPAVGDEAKQSERAPGLAR